MKKNKNIAPASSQNETRAKISRCLTATAQAVIVLILLWILLWLAMGDRLAYLGYINAAGFVIVLAAAAAALILLFTRRWLSAAFGMAIASALWIMASGLNFGAGADFKAQGSVRVLSASLRGLNKDMRSAAIQIAGYDPDIIALQEVSDPAKFEQALIAQTGKAWFVKADGGYAVLSRYPLSAAPNAPKYLGSAQVNVGGKAIVLWNLHAPKAFARPAENSGYYADLVDAARAQRPDIILGDFNATPWNYGYRLMAKEMIPAHDAAGFGPGNSFPAPARRSGLLGAFSRIDHIFVAKNIRVANAFTGQASAGADHHPVVADIRF